MDERERKDRLKLQKRFGDHLRKVREQAGITAAELSRRCDMERSNIARLEAGRSNPSLYIIKKICSGLEMELDEFLKGLK